MIKKYAIPVFSIVLVVFFLLSGCTNKEINLITNIDFEAYVEGAEEGFVKDSLNVTVSVIPQQPYPDFYYYVKYEITTGEGYFVDASGEVIPENEDRLLPEGDAYIANWKYIGTNAEEHLVKFYYRDNYERRKEALQGFTIKNINILWDASSEITRARVKDSIPVLVQLENQTEGRDVDFSYQITLSEGAGVLLDAAKEPIEKGKPIDILPGATQLLFVPLQGGVNTLTFDLLDSNGQELQDSLSFTIEGEIINLAPTAVDDEVEVTVGVEKIIAVLDNDTDPETDMLKVEAIVRPPNNGAVVINEDGTITYTPKIGLPPGVSDSFTYRIKDDPTGNLSENEATVQITFIDRETIPIADAEFEQNLIALGLDKDGAVNGVIYKDDALAIMELDIPSDLGQPTSISDFSGIEYFENLLSISYSTSSNVTLNLNQNRKLEKISLSYFSFENVSFSELQNVKELTLSNVGNIIIDFSVTKNLETIRFSFVTTDSGNFTDLDNLKSVFLSNVTFKDENFIFSNNKFLEELRLHNIAIGSQNSIDISKNVQLDSFELRPATTEGSVPNVSTIECIQVKDINEALNNENWTIPETVHYSLDCSQPRETIAIPDSVFEERLREQGFDSDGVTNGMIYETDALAITTLDLVRTNQTATPRPDIKDFTGIESFENLVELSCSSWGPNILNLNNNKSIERLFIGFSGTDYMEFQELENLKELRLNYSSYSKSLLGFKKLELLSAAFGSFASGDFREFNNLKSIGISFGGFTDGTFDISKNNLLENLSIPSRSVGTTLDISNKPLLKKLNLFRLASTDGDLGCVQVNNVDDAIANPDWKIPQNAYYSKDCNQPGKAIPFDNRALEQALVDLGYDNVVDDMLFEDRIRNLKSLDVRDKNLTSLNGIEIFTALEFLTANKNSLTAIDLSQNPRLKTVNLDDNQLTSVDLVNNPEITSLKLDNNMISEIGLSNNAKLKTLNIDSNQLTEINLSNNIELEFLDLDRNDISEIDVSKNTKLQNLFITDNELTSIDVSKNSELTTLDLSLNKNMTSIDVSFNLKLRQLGAARNMIKSLDLSNNKALTTLFIFVTQIQEIDLSNQTNLNNLSAFGNEIVSLDLSNNSKITSLNVRDNKLKDLDISNMPNLNKLFAQTNSGLNCIKVADKATADANPEWIKDDTTNFETDCQ